jgi:hypothetical protein
VLQNVVEIKLNLKCNTSTKYLEDYMTFSGGAVIINPPVDQTVLERMEVIFHCEGQANPGNLSVNWYKGNLPVKSIDEGALSERASIRFDQLFSHLICRLNDPTFKVIYSPNKLFIFSNNFAHYIAQLN